ncbi:hypothetical protein P3T76_001716 [Phytophthora citrophthora]|uniref:Uncharacterized protein n=1 Tax=Phytophthora citrophthora TaxID=4793 RepID=A0AAD9LT47_9STRA|nr:hypothetical protein P3T76_001716 [Phytophthora citrophthora]
MCYVFPLVPHVVASDLPGEKTYSQEEAILYWENLEEKEDKPEAPPVKRVRGRPNVAKYINCIIIVVTDKGLYPTAAHADRWPYLLLTSPRFGCLCECVAATFPVDLHTRFLAA